MSHVAAADEGQFHAALLSRTPKIAVPTRTIVDPAATAASRSADIPSDSVSQRGCERSQAIEQRLHPQQRFDLPAGLAFRLRNGHQAAQYEPRQPRHLGRQCSYLVRCHAALRLFAADIDLQQHVERWLVLRTLLGQALRHLQAVDRLGPLEVFRDLARLVALDRPDEMPLNRSVRRRLADTSDLVHGFLNVVLAKVALAAAGCREHGLGREGLADGNQRDFALQAPRGSRSLGNALVDPVQIGLQGLSQPGHNRKERG